MARPTKLTPELFDKIVAFVKRHPRSTQKAMCEAVGILPRTFCRWMARKDENNTIFQRLSERLEALERELWEARSKEFDRWYEEEQRRKEQKQAIQAEKNRIRAREYHQRQKEKREADRQRRIQKILPEYRLSEDQAHQDEFKQDGTQTVVQQKEEFDEEKKREIERQAIERLRAQFGVTPEED